MRRRNAASPSGGAHRRNMHDGGSLHDSVTSRVLTLWTHQPPNFSRHDFVMNPSYGLPQISDAELLMVLRASDSEALHVAKHGNGDVWPLLQRAIVFTPIQALADQEVIHRQQQLQLSMSQQVASLADLTNRTQIVLSRTPRSQHQLTHMELYFKGQYLGRADMWRLSLSLLETCIYVGQTVKLPTGLRAKVGRLFIHEHSVASGFVSASVKPIFRTESARARIMVQMSREMWEFDEGGEIYYEKVLQGFLPALLRKWDVVGTSHRVSVVLFTRVLYEESERAHLEGLPVQRTDNGQYYVDYYKVVMELDSMRNWPHVMRRLKEEFFRFQHDILLQARWSQGRVVPTQLEDEDIRQDSAVGGRVLLGRFAPAYEGNILESINLALNSAERHYIDRDLSHTGFMLIVVTAGTGHFYVDKTLLRLTTQRVFDLGLAVDLVCMSQMPLHVVPVFHYMSTVASDASGSRLVRGSTDPLFFDNMSHAPREMFHNMPFWVNCSFYNMEQDRPYWESQFVSRCRMDGVGVSELLSAGQQELALPYMNLGAGSSGLSTFLREQHDRDIFALEPRSMPNTAPTTPHLSTNGGPTWSTQPSCVSSQTSTPTRVAPLLAHASPALSTASDMTHKITSTVPSHRSPWRISAAQLASTTRAPSIASSRRSTRTITLDDPGKALAMVGETVTSLVAVPQGSVSQATRPARGSTTSLWRKLFSFPRPDRRHVITQATAGDASRLLCEALGRSSPASTATTQESVLVVHSTVDETRFDATAEHYDTGDAMASPVVSTYVADSPSHSLSPVSKMTATMATATAMTGANTTASGLPGPMTAQEGGDWDTSTETPRLDPSNLRQAFSEHNAMLLRWQYVFLERSNHHAVKWWSMTMPASLPLTTRYLPTEHELATSWHEYPYTVSVHSDTRSIMLRRGSSTSPALAMLREMCAQRLAQGFQLVERAVLRPGVAPGTRDAKQYVIRHPSELLRPGNFADGDPLYLSTMNQVHCISYHRPTGMIHVTRYVKKVPYSTAPYSYRCCIWPRLQAGFKVASTPFSYPDPHAYNWTYLDSMIAGYEDTFTESLRYWRARFVVVPSEGSPSPYLTSSGEPLNDEETRLLGMDRLADLFARAEYHAPGQPHRSRALPLRFLPTTLDPSCSLHDTAFLDALTALNQEISRHGISLDTNRPQQKAHDLSLKALAEAMHHARAALKVHDRVWHRVRYPDTFTGADLVSWLCRSYADIHTREDAVQWGRKLLEAHLIEHVTASHSFMDGHYFYRLLEVERGWHSSEPTSGLSSSTTAPPLANISSSTPTSTSNAARSSHPKRRRIQLSRSMLIDVDPGRRSNRAEVAMLHHDLSHNAENGFNFQIHWLGTTARLIDDLVQTWMRTVERYGLRLVEAPIAQIKDSHHHNPFLSAFPIGLALAPPKKSSYLALCEQVKQIHTIAAYESNNDLESWVVRYVLSRDVLQIEVLFETALVRQFGFVLDQEAQANYPEQIDLHYSSRPNNFDYSQYVHRSGIAFIQVIGGRDGYLWLNNRLLNSHVHMSRSHTSKPMPPPEGDFERRAFQRMCHDKDALASFYETVWDILKRAANGPDNI